MMVIEVGMLKFVDSKNRKGKITLALRQGAPNHSVIHGFWAECSI